MASAGRPAPSSAATRGSVSPAGVSARAIAAEAARSARCQSSSQPRSRRRPRRSPVALRVATGSAAAIVATEPVGSCHAFSGSNAICSAASRPASHWRSGFEVGRSPTRSTSSGAWAAAQRGVAQQRVVVRDGCGAAAAAGQRVGEQRDRRALGEVRQRGTEPGVALRSSRDEHRARGVPRARPAGRRRARAARGARRAAGSPTARPPGRPSSDGGSGPSSTSGSRREKFRCTGPGRPSSAVRNARHASWRSQRRRAGVAGASSTSRNHFAAAP